jgi:sec-independent protein translocase protein TatC
MTKHRKHTIVIILIVAGLITPSPDAFTQLVVAIPLYALYEISVILQRGIPGSRKYPKPEEIQNIYCNLKQQITSNIRLKS